MPCFLQFYNDFLRNPQRPEFKGQGLESFAAIPAEKTYDDRNVEKAFVKLSAAQYADKVRLDVCPPLCLVL